MNEYENVTMVQRERDSVRGGALKDVVDLLTPVAVVVGPILQDKIKDSREQRRSAEPKKAGS